MHVPDRRPPAAQRRFVSRPIDDIARDVGARIADPVLARLFMNCFPNVLDTMVDFTKDFHGGPDTFVISGDIPAMWYRDSTAQIWPYVDYAGEDPAIERLVAGLIRRHALCARLDPFANSFMKDPGTLNERKKEDRAELILHLQRNRPHLLMERY